MSTNHNLRPLKVCSTCCHWSYKYKGLCSRLNQGVGRFWTCQDWTGADQPAPPSGDPEAPGAAAP